MSFGILTDIRAFSNILPISHFLNSGLSPWSDSEIFPVVQPNDADFAVKSIWIGLTQVVLLYHRRLLVSCALRTSLFFQSLPANEAPYRQNCVSPVGLGNYGSET